MSIRKKLLLMFMMISVILIFSSCSSANKHSKSFDSVDDRVVEEDTGVSCDSAEEEVAEAPNSDSQIDDNKSVLTKEQVTKNKEDSADNKKQKKPNTQHKIIKNIDITLETLKFDNLLNVLNQQVEKNMGYIQSSNIEGNKLFSNYDKSLRSANIVIRISSENLDKFKNQITNNKLAHIINESQGSEDVTYQYYDTESKLKSLRIQEDRIFKILEKTTELKDITHLEQRLSEIRYEIETLTTTLKRYDQLVKYATVNISINEVKEPTEILEPTNVFSKRIKQTFVSSAKAVKRLLENIILLIIAFIPFIAILILIIPLVWLIRLTIKKRKKKYKKD